MATNYTRWYRVGWVKLTKNSTLVVGTQTYWGNIGLHPGDLFTLDGSKFYEIDTITDNTHLTLKTPYAEASNNETTYGIVRNFTAAMPAEIAAQTVDLLGDVRRYIDTDMQSIHGKSAYEVAVAHGYVGTESEWLNYLIGAGKWVELDTATKASLSAFDTRLTAAQRSMNDALAECDELDARTELLTLHNAAQRNQQYRGKNLGTEFTAAQYNAIKSGSFEDLYVGDYWVWGNGKRAIIVHFNYPFTFNKGDGNGRYRPGNCLTIRFEMDIESSLRNTSADRDIDPRYTLSDWYTTSRPIGLAQAEAFFGADRLQSWEASESVFNLETLKYTGQSRFYGKFEMANQVQTHGVPMFYKTDSGYARVVPDLEAKQFAGCRLVDITFNASRDPVGYANGWRILTYSPGEYYVGRITNSCQCGVIVVG